MPFVLLAAMLPTPARAERHLLQVETFDGPWRRQTNIKGYLGAGFCTSNANPKIASTVMRSKIRVRERGRYAVWVRGFTSAPSQPARRRGMQVEVAGVRLRVTHSGRRPDPPRGSQWRWELAGEVELAPGEATVVVHDADTGYESADAVLVTNRRDEDPMAEERGWSIYPGGVPDRASALRYNIDRCSALLRARTDPASLEEWTARRGKLDAALRRALRPWPGKTPLSARVTGRAERETYVIENVVFESLPGFCVTANVYVPKRPRARRATPRGGEMLPAVIVTAGHAMEPGKNHDPYRQAQLGLVREGFIVLAYDPIGQGERRRPGNSHQVAFAAFLVGHTALGYMTWDTIRALDYLLTRDDVDPKRIGVTGNSGGGMNTFYTMAVDSRLAAAASFCFTCSYRAWIEDGGNHCICNHLPGICRELEEFEIVALASPRPFLAGNGSKDRIFPIRGTRRTIERARKVYGFHGAADSVTLVEAAQGHGWSKELREASYGWFRRHLLGAGDGSPVPEVEAPLEGGGSKDLRCLKDGRMPAGARTFVDLVREEAERLVRSYKPVPAGKVERERWAGDLRRELWRTLGGEPERLRVGAERLDSFTWQGRRAERLAIRTEDTLEVPAVFVRPTGPAGPVPAVVFLSDEGKGAARASPVVLGLLERGVAVLAMDVRGTGEVAAHANHTASDAVVLGRPLLAQQAWDVLCAARYLAGRDDVAEGRVAVYGAGSVGVIAILAAALADDVSAVAAEGAIGSFVHAVADPLPQPLWVYAPGVLLVADVPQMLALAAPKPALWVGPVGADGKALPEAEVAALSEPARTSYRAAGVAEGFAVCTDANPAGRIVTFLEGALGER